MLHENKQVAYTYTVLYDSPSRSKPANGEHRDVGHRLHQGVLYCQNVIHLDGAQLNVTQFTAVKNSPAFRTPTVVQLATV